MEEEHNHIGKERKHLTFYSRMYIEDLCSSTNIEKAFYLYSKRPIKILHPLFQNKSAKSITLTLTTYEPVS